MADEYTPTTDQVRDAWTYASTGGESERTDSEARDLFNRWFESELEAARQGVREQIAQDIEAEAERMILLSDVWTRGEERHLDGLGRAIQIVRGTTR